MQKDIYLVVVSILEGRNFPKRAKHQLQVECKFDGELLSTDPIEHSDTPDFTTELAWELDKKALHQHRMQRTPIKLQCYAINTTNGVRELIGYILLDLRLAQPKPQGPKWYSLLSSKYSRLKPAIKVGLALEDDLPTQDNAFRARDAPPRPGKSIPSEKELTAILDEEEGHFQIGPPENCYDMFMLSVTVAFAANLEQLIPTDKRLSGASTGYFFYYNLLGNDVANDPFPDLLNPEFVPERASVRIRSSVDVLRAYFLQQPSIQVHLCSGDYSLGSATTPLDSLLKKGSKEIEIKPIIIEGAFTLFPPNAIQQQLQATIEAKVGVSICLKREGIPSQNPSMNYSPKDAIEVPPPNYRSAAPQDIPERDIPMDEENKKAKKIPRRPASPEFVNDQTPETQVGQRTSTPSPVEVKPFVLETDDDEISIRSEDIGAKGGRQKTKPRFSQATEKGTESLSEPITVSESTNLTTTETHPVLPPQSRHYRFSLHLKCISDLDLPFTCNAFLKYSYPFFGSAAPVMTSPPILVSKKAEVSMPRSLCTFDFACTASLLHNTFNSVPLVVELWHADKESDNMLVATVVMPLNILMTQEPSQFVLPGSGKEKDKEGVRWLYSAKLHMVSVQGSGCKVADLSVSMTLEDYGVVREQKLQVLHHQPGAKAVVPNPKQKKAVAVPSPPKKPHPRESAEYEAAVELELWKEQREEDFENQLKEKEIAHMRSLAEEWQRRDKEREALVSKRVTEYNRMEAKLRKSLAEIESREKQLANNERELARIRTDVQREHERVVAQAKEATARMKEDCVHQVQLERGRIRALEEDKTTLRAQLVEAEKKYAVLEQKFQSFKLEQNNLPEVRLQSELQLLTLEKNELERKLESVNKSKLHYKQQWGRALKELARLKQREQDHALANLKQQQQELEQMRMKYFTNEEREANQRGQKQISEIKQELDRLKAKESSGPKRQSPSIVIGSASAAANQEHHPDVTVSRAHDHVEEHVARLIEERDTLLRTGVYTREDRIIVELDRQIREAISRKTNLS